MCLSVPQNNIPIIEVGEFVNIMYSKAERYSVDAFILSYCK